MTNLMKKDKEKTSGLWGSGFFGDFERFFEDMDRALQSTSWSKPLRQNFDFMPSTDVQENKENYVLTLDIPGVKEEDVKVEVNNGRLVVSGERRTEEKTEDTKVYRVERNFGRFVRAFPLPDDVDSEKIEAALEQGELHVVIPKSVASKPKSIKIGDKKESLLGRIFGSEEKSEEKIH